MALSHELISQFAKQIAVKDKIVNKESTVYGTVHVDEAGKKYVQLDGSDQLTPLSVGDLATSMSVNAKDGERVSVLIKNHTATVVGNMSSPAARTGDVDDAVTKFGVIVTEHIQAVTAYVDTLQANNAKVGDLEAANAKIGNLEADVADIKEAQIDEAEINNLIANHAKIGSLETDVADIKELKADEADVTQLNTEFLEFSKATGDSIRAHQGAIDDLEAKKLSAESAAITYANIDFANITAAAVQKIFSESGIIKDLIVSDGKITGELVGVTIKGDLIEGNTVKADKLVVLGDDGLYYKLNFEAGNFKDSEEIPADSLHGSVITAKSIVAEHIAVDDLVAFGATIGGFHITDNSLYSGVKSGVNNTTRGIYLDNDGQIAFGDSSNFVKFYKDTDGAYKLAIRAASLSLGSSGKNVEKAVGDAEQAAANAQATANAANTNAANAQATANTAVTNAANAQATADNAKTAIDELQVGGRNLLPKSKYTEDIAEIQENSSSGYGFICPGLQTGVAVPGMITDLNLKTNTDYTVSFVAWLDTTDTTARQTLSWDLWPDNLPQEFIYADINGLCNVPQKYSWTIRSDQAEMANCNLRFIIFEADGEGYTAKYPIYITDIKLEEGNKATDWTPAPEDVDDAIDAAQDKAKEAYNKANTAQNTADSANNKIDNLEVGARNLLRNSNVETTKEPGAVQAEFVQYADLAPIFDEYGLIEYTLSFDLKSADVTSNNRILVYCINGSVSKHTIPATYVTVTTEYKRYSLTFTPSIQSATETKSMLSFYGTYNTGNIPCIKNVKLEKGNKATDWTPAPEDVDEAVSDAQDKANSADGKADDTAKQLQDAFTRLDILEDRVLTLVRNKNGNSLVVDANGDNQTWYFNTGNIDDSIGQHGDDISDLKTKSSSMLDKLDEYGEDIANFHERFTVSVFEDEPCIIFHESDSDRVQIITNTRRIFATRVGDDNPATDELEYTYKDQVISDYETTRSPKIEAEQSVTVGGWVWEKRLNGNLGLTWKDVTS